MVLVTGYLSAVHVAAFFAMAYYGIVYHPIAGGKFIVAVVVLVCLGFNWACIAQFNKERKFLRRNLWFVAWGVLIIIVTHSPFVGKGAGIYMTSPEVH